MQNASTELARRAIRGRIPNRNTLGEIYTAMITLIQLAAAGEKTGISLFLAPINVRCLTRMEHVPYRISR